jgi:hypothetical protein
MRQTISGMVAAVAVMMTMGAAPAMASCYANPCAAAPVYVSPAPVYSGCNTGCGYGGNVGYGYGGYGGWASERLPDPVHQYYYVNQGPTYSGPGNYAPRPVYQESSVSYGNSYYGGYRARPYYGARYGVGYGAGYRYGVRPGLRYGYGARVGYGPRLGYGPRVGHYGARHGYAHRHGMHHHGGGRHVMRRHH